MITQRSARSAIHACATITRKAVLFAVLLEMRAVLSSQSRILACCPPTAQCSTATVRPVYQRAVQVRVSARMYALVYCSRVQDKGRNCLARVTFCATMMCRARQRSLFAVFTSAKPSEGPAGLAGRDRSPAWRAQTAQTDRQPRTIKSRRCGRPWQQRRAALASMRTSFRLRTLTW